MLTVSGSAIPSDLLIRLNKRQTAGTLLRKTYRDASRQEHFWSVPPTPNSHPKLVSGYLWRAWFHPGIILHPEEACSHSEHASYMQVDHGRNGHRETCWVGWKAISWVCWLRNRCTRWHTTASNRSPCVHGGGSTWKLEAANCLLFDRRPQWRRPVNLVTQCVCRLYDLDVTVLWGQSFVMGHQ